MDLSVILKGQKHSLRLHNPIIAASGTYGTGLEYLPFGDIAKLGGISVKGISLAPRPGASAPRIVETAAGMLNAVGLQNDGVENFLARKLPQLPWQDTAIIANIYAASIEEFSELAARLNDTRAIAALEINVSCPNVADGGMSFGANPQTCAQVVAAVRQNAPDKHLMVKLTPNVASIAEIARSAEAAGADSISCINTLSGMAVDLSTRRPALGNITGGLSGPAIKPVALRCVWEASRAVKIPVVGIGGITCVDDILEFFLVGAAAVQIGTANFMRPDAAFRLLDELPAALERMNVASPAELCGKLLVD